MVLHSRGPVSTPPAGFGDLLRGHRRAAGLTQEALAERAGLSPRSISEMERGGEHVPRRDTVHLLVRALGLAEPDRETFVELVERSRGPRALADRPRATQPGFERPKHNLARSLTTFVGRERELAELGRLLATAPLLTLVGAGGVGKTRLAQELARAHVTDYADGSWLVELASLADETLVPSAVAVAVGLRDGHAGNIATALAEYLRDRKMLLVLDNCEHLIEACAELVAALLRTCPNLQVLATSRQPLAIAGEVNWAVPPLELPEAHGPHAHEQIRQSSAVRLFIERARAVNNALILSPENLPVIARICIGVDGIPLALELAAARARVLTVEQIADRLDYDTGVLGRTVRAGLPQHQTIRATIDWSYELLCEQERVLLRRLSVFAGGWTLQLAEVVCSGAGIDQASVLDLLEQLVDKSMVLVDARNAVARYRLLEPIRHYALGQLEASGESTDYQARHAAAFLELAQIGEAEPAGPSEIASLDQLQVEHDNLRVALQWALTNHESTAALRSASALLHFWERRGHFQEGCSWLQQALAEGADGPALYRARALNALACLYWRGAFAEHARPIAEEGLVVSREAESPREIALALLNLGMIAYFQGETDVALAWLQATVTAARQAGHVTLLSIALAFLGRILLWAGGPAGPGVAAALNEGLALAEAVQSRAAIGHAMMTLGDVAWRQGGTQRAIPLWRRALVVRAELADRRGIAGAIERLAWALVATDQLEQAAWLFGASDAQHARLGIGLRCDEADDHAELVAQLRQHLGPAFATSWSAGEVSTVDEAVVRGLEATAGIRGTLEISSGGYAHNESDIGPATPGAHAGRLWR